MINLEFYREKIKDFLDDNLSFRDELSNTFGYEVNYRENFVSKFIDWMLQEYKEPINLKQWEYDLLDIWASPNTKFKNHTLLMELSAKGHFKGIEDISMTPKDILDNCEVELE